MSNKSNNTDATVCKELKKVPDPAVGTRGVIVRDTKHHTGTPDSANFGRITPPYDNDTNDDFKTGTASAGTNQPAHKSNDADGAEQARKTWVKTHKPEAVREVDPDANAGACVASAQRQAEGDGSDKGVVNGNPKKKASSAWGRVKNPQS